MTGTRQFRNAQFMTPETRSTTHFFRNYLHDFDLDNPNIALSLRHSLEEAFNEDLAIIEAQQKVFDADPNYQLLAIGADAALTYFRWVLAPRIEAEKSAATPLTRRGLLCPHKRTSLVRPVRSEQCQKPKCRHTKQTHRAAQRRDSFRLLHRPEAASRMACATHVGWTGARHRGSRGMAKGNA
jgi:hypothetical protein